MKLSRDDRTTVCETVPTNSKGPLGREKYESPAIRHLDLARVITGTGGTHLDFETDGSPTQGY